MTYEEYIVGVSEHLPEYLPESLPEEAVRVVPVVQDGVVYPGVKIRFTDKNHDWQPLELVINLQRYYRKVENLPFEQAIRETKDMVVETLKKQSLSEIQNVTRILTDFTAAKSHLYVELQNIKREPERFRQSICKKIPGTAELALVANIHLTLPNGEKGSFEIRETELEKWGVTRETVTEIACQNALEQHGIRIEPVDARLPNVLELSAKDQYQDLQEAVFHNPFVVTNRDCFYGAATFFCPGIIEKLGDLIGDYSFAPVTLNHVAVVPVQFEENRKPALLKNILRELTEEFPGVTTLSDNIYCYNAKTRRMMLASDYEKQEKEAPQKGDKPNLYPKHKGQNPRL